MSDNLNILDAIAAPDIFSPWFRSGTWDTWVSFYCALFGLAMTPDQLALFQQCTGRSVAPTVPVREGWLVCGRRAGKSFALALVAVFLAAFHDYTKYLAPGERATILILAADRKQSRVIFRYITALLKQVPMLAQLIEAERSESFELSTRVTIEIATCSFRTVRGYTLAAVLADELAFWRSEDSASPDYEVLNAVRPGMITIPSAMLLCASSPYARRGALWDAHQKYFGIDDPDVLVWQAATRTMNPTVSQAYIDKKLEEDHADASAEYLAQFRTDVEAFITLEAIKACIEPGVYERTPEHRHAYFAFVDPCGGSADSFTMSIGHTEGDQVVIDCVRECRSPLSPEVVVADFAQTLKQYRITTVVGDNYAGQWPADAFAKHGISYEKADRTKSQLYLAVLPLINSRKITLLDSDRMVRQFVGLDRRTQWGGKDSIDHGPGGNDDVANAVAGCAALANRADNPWHRLVERAFGK
jgi:hypothetical protein